jgi:hypothetical protein
MKKLLLALTAFVVMTSMTFAQKKEAPKAKTEKAAPAAKPAAAPAAGPTKKDGTPDKRYKENKGAPTTAPAGPTKKDGTPDMRYKANKDAAPKKKG